MKYKFDSVEIVLVIAAFLLVVAAFILNDLMMPFITISGVLVSFLAFYIQFKANRIQQEEISKLRVEKEQELIKQYKSVLSLFLMDLKSLQENSEMWVAGLNTYKLQLEQDPSKTVTGHLVKSKYLERFRSIDRNKLKFAFDYYNIDDENISESVTFGKTYDTVESYYEFVVDLYCKLEGKDIEIKKLYTTLVEVFKKLITKSGMLDENGMPYKDFILKSFDGENGITYEIIRKKYIEIKNNEAHITKGNYSEELKEFIAKYNQFEESYNALIENVGYYSIFVKGRKKFFEERIAIIEHKLEFGAKWPLTD